MPTVLMMQFDCTSGGSGLPTARNCPSEPSRKRGQTMPKVPPGYTPRAYEYGRCVLCTGKVGKERREGGLASQVHDQTMPMPNWCGSADCRKSRLRPRKSTRKGCLSRVAAKALHKKAPFLW